MAKKNKHDEKIEKEEVLSEIEEIENLPEIKLLNDEIAELKAENEKLKNDYYKAFADAENYKKRAQRDIDNTLKYRIQSFATSILPAIDNLERALANADDSDPMKQGVAMIYNQIINALKEEGVEEIDALNKVFDANYHQAIMSEKVDGTLPNIVVEVLQKGYILKDRILRPSYVKVSE